MQKSRFRTLVENILSENTKKDYDTFYSFFGENHINESGEKDKNIITFSYDTYKKMILYPFEDEYNKLISKNPNAQINCKQSIYNITEFTKYISYCDSTLTVQFIVSNKYDFRGHFTTENDKKLIIICLNNVFDMDNYMTVKSYDEALIDIEMWKAILNQRQIISIFIHEFQHFVDFCKKGITKSSYYDYKYKLPPRQYASIYANSPEEKNAYTIQKMFDLTYELSDKYAGDENGLNKKNASEFINYYLKNGGWKNDPRFLGFYNLLNDNNKKSIIKRLYVFFTEFFDE